MDPLYWHLNTAIQEPSLLQTGNNTIMCFLLRERLHRYTIELTSSNERRYNGNVQRTQERENKGISDRNKGEKELLRFIEESFYGSRKK